MYQSERLPISLYVIVSCIGIFALSFWIQYITYINPDVAWHLWVAGALRNGAVLYQDIIEVNLPLIYYGAILPHAIGNMFDIPILIAELLLTNSLSCLCFIACFYLIRHNYSFSYTQQMAYIIALAIILFILPLCLSTNNIGQKEHKFLIFTLPYITYTLNQTLIRQRIIRIPIAIAAAIGFCIKPYFVIIWITIEWLRYKQHGYKPWLTLESWIIAVIGACYLLSIILLFPTYFTTIIPLAQDAYINNPTQAIFHLFLQLSLIFQPLGLPLIAIILFGLIQSMSTIRFISYLCLSAIAVALLQCKGLDYQLLPAIAYAFLLTALIFPHLIDIFKQHWQASRTLPRSLLHNFIMVFLPLSLGNLLFAGLSYNAHNHYINNITALPTIAQTISKYDAHESTLILGKLTQGFPLTLYANLTWHLPMSSIWPLDSLDSSVQYDYARQIYDIIMNQQPTLIVIDISANSHYNKKLRQFSFINTALNHYEVEETLDSTVQILKIKPQTDH